MRATLVAVVADLFASAAGLGAAEAAWRDDVKVLRVGFLSQDSPASELARLEPFRAYLEARLALPVELVPATSGASLVDAQTTGRVQYAIDTAAEYSSAAALCGCVEPLVLPAAFDGSRGFYSVLLVRADNAAKGVADLKGARVAMGAEDSVAGRLVPLKELAAAGYDPSTYFSALYASPGMTDGIVALLDGRADAAVAWSSLAGDAGSGYSFGVLADMVAAGKLAMDQVRIVWQSQLIPFGPHAIRSDMPAEEKSLLRDALLAMAREAPDVLDGVDRSSLGGGGFVPAAAADYAAIDALVAPAKDAATTAP